MPEYLHPGVYVEEISGGARPIESVGTSTAAFIGFTDKRPSDNNGEPLLVTSWTQYTQKFGQFAYGFYTPLAVYGFFENGGGACFVASILTGEQLTSGASSAVLKDAQNADVLKVKALTGKTFTLKITEAGTKELELPNAVSGSPAAAPAPDAASAPPAQYTLTIAGADGKTLETYTDLSLDLADDNSILRKVRASKLIKLEPLGPVATLADVEDQALDANTPVELPGDGTTKVLKVTQLPSPPLKLTVANASAPPADASASSQPPAKIQRKLYTLELVDDKNHTQEKYTGLSFDPAAGKSLLDYVNANSKLIQLQPVTLDADLKAATLQASTTQLSETTSALVVVARPGAPGAEKKADPLGTPLDLDGGGITGLEGLEAIDEAAIVCAPDIMFAWNQGWVSQAQVIAYQQALITHCEKMRDRVAVLDSPPGQDVQAIQTWRKDTANFASDNGYAALYYPWIRINDPRGAGLVSIPPSGHVAGVYARVDIQRGVHKAPANESLKGAVELERRVSDSEQNFLNPLGINCIRAFPGSGIRVWGARTLAQSASEWKYVPVRRLFCMIEKSLQRGTQWAVFEPNDIELWEKLKRDIGAYLTNVWRTGALFGVTEPQAFFVKCDEELNPKEVRDAGQVIVHIGLAPVKPAEFVIIRIQQTS